MKTRIVTFTTDFGLNEHYVGTMKGVILGINPEVGFVDICNFVPSFDVLEGALTLMQAYHYFPPGTVHLVVIDPGVGTARRPIVADTGRYLFVAPDNGVLSLVYEREERVTVRHITAEHYFLQPVSNTFHGRDIFAPVAGYLTKNVDLLRLGDEIQDYLRLSLPRPERSGERMLSGVVLKVDKFGNLITNFTANDLPHLFQGEPPPFRISVGKGEATTLRSAYGVAAPGEVFGILGSMGYLEISINGGAASQLLDAKRGSAVLVQW